MLLQISTQAIFPIFIAVIGILTSALLRYLDTSSENDLEYVKEIESSRLGDVCEVVGKAIHNAKNSDVDPSLPDDATGPERQGIILRKSMDSTSASKVNEDYMEELDTKLEWFREPSDLNKECNNLRKQSVMLIVISVTTALSVLLLLLVGFGDGTEPVLTVNGNSADSYLIYGFSIASLLFYSWGLSSTLRWAYQRYRFNALIEKEIPIMGTRRLSIDSQAKWFVAKFSILIVLVFISSVLSALILI